MLPASSTSSSSSSTPSLIPNPFAVHWSHYPRTYVAHRLEENSVRLIDSINGDLTKDAWSRAPWSDLFDDIRGAQDAPAADRPRPTCPTRMKMLWDDHYLYIGALLTSDFETVATFHQRNSPIYQQDSDFEVFVDPTGSCRDYKELEVNAINTVWNLMLDKPYNDDGQEHSGRVAKPGDERYYEVYQQKTAVRLLQGQLNDPNGGGTVWSVEIALAHSDTLASHQPPQSFSSSSAVAATAAAVSNSNNNSSHRWHPKPWKTKWRINFSRVERRGEINWTWQPQIAWDAANRRFQGQVNMHLPESWGYVVFGGETSDEGESSSLYSEQQPQQQHQQHLQHPPVDVIRDETWPGRLAAANVYYAQHEYRRVTGSFAANLSDLRPWLDDAILKPFTVFIETQSRGKLSDPGVATVTSSSSSSSFVATLYGNPNGSVVSITDDRHVTISFSRKNNEAQNHSPTIATSSSSATQQE